MLLAVAPFAATVAQPAIVETPNSVDSEVQSPPNGNTAELMQLIGQPFSARYKPAGVDVFPQHFDMAQQDNGVLLVANADGLLEFDGARWWHYPMPGEELVRSVAIDNKGRIFVGSYGQFGEMQRRPDGVLEFNDFVPMLTAAQQAEFIGDVWLTHAVGDYVYFLTYDRIFRWSEYGIDAFHAEEGLGLSFTAFGQYFYRDRAKGLMVLGGDSPYPVPKAGRFSELALIAVVPLDGNRLFFVTGEGYEIFDLTDGRTELLPDSLIKQMPESETVYVGERLTDGTIALGTTTGSLVHLNRDLTEATTMEIGPGAITALHIGQEGGLWALDDDGLLRLALPSEATYFDFTDGIRGALSSAAFWQHGLLVTTTSGVYNRKPQGTRFERLPWGVGEFWDNEILEGFVLLCDSSDVYVKSLDEALEKAPVKLTEASLSPRSFRRSPFHEKLVILQSEGGLAFIDVSDEVRLIADHTELNMRSYYAHALDARRFVLGTVAHGVQLLEFSQDLTEIVSQRRLDASDSTHNAYTISRVQDQLIASSDGGQFSLSEDGLSPLAMDALIGYPNKQAQTEFVETPDNQIWGATDRRLYRARETEDGWQWKEQNIGQFTGTAVEFVTMLSDGYVWVGAGNALIRVQPNFSEREVPEPQLLLRKATLEFDGKLMALPVDAETWQLSAAEADGELMLEFALPTFRNSESLTFRSKLGVSDAPWSDWRLAANRRFAKLPVGAYPIQAQGRTGSGDLIDYEHPIEVLPLWYQEPWARWLLFLASVLIIGLLVYFGSAYRSRVLRERNQELAKRVEKRSKALRQRTLELEQANRKLDDLAHQDGLTGIANRRRLEAYLNEEFTRCSTQNEPMAVLLLDADHFKAFNDANGHLAGDQVLISLANFLNERITDEQGLVSRFGGEEFAIVLPGAELASAMRLAESLRLGVLENPKMMREITVSIGVALLYPDEKTVPSDILDAADRAMYRAKTQGRNRVST